MGISNYQSQSLDLVIKTIHFVAHLIVTIRIHTQEFNCFDLYLTKSTLLRYFDFIIQAQIEELLVIRSQPHFTRKALFVSLVLCKPKSLHHFGEHIAF